MIKVIGEYQLTIEEPCYFVFISEQAAEYNEDEKQLANTYIKTVSDFYIVDTFEKVEMLLDGEKVEDAIYPYDIFACSILVPNIYKIIKNSLASGFTAWFQYDESYINEPILNIESFVMTPDKAMSLIQSFARLVANYNDPELIFNKWLEITNMVGIDVDYLHLETYLAQTLACQNDEFKLFRNSECNKAQLLNLKAAVKNLYPVRALFFENLAAQITQLPLLKEDDLSTLDKLLIGKI